eukprot:354470-Chlamydomonas_euryale.AAC.48
MSSCCQEQKNQHEYMANACMLFTSVRQSSVKARHTQGIERSEHPSLTSVIGSRSTVQAHRIRFGAVQSSP